MPAVDFPSKPSFGHIFNKKTVAEIINKFYETLKNKRFIVIYSHEYEFKKKIILSTLNKTMDILTNKLKLKNIHP